MTSNLKPLVACYKSFRGGEWFTASLESIRQHVAGVVAVTTEQPWLGHRGTESRAVAMLPENCRGPLTAFKDRHPDLPVTDIRLSGRVNSEDQYRVGLAAIHALHGVHVGVLIVDTDEVWDDASLTHLRYAMTRDQSARYFRSGIRTYLRSPLYRVTPQEQSRAVVGLAHAGVPIGDSRFSNVPGPFHDAPGAIHHLGYVRLDAEEIIAKLSNTSSQDAVPFNPRWKQEVWDALPVGRNLHPVSRVAHFWKAVEELTAGDLPPEVSSSPAFWACLGHHRGGPPRAALLVHDAAWRMAALADVTGISTTTPSEHAIPLCAGLQGRLSLDACVRLVPRLRMSLRETFQLAAHAAGVPSDGIIVEIGSGMGGSMAIMGISAPPGADLIAVDPFVPYDEVNITLCKDTEVGTEADFWQTMDIVGLGPLLLTWTSAEAVAQWPVESKLADLVLVDGNHSYEYALHDLLAWWPLLKPGGTMLLHDLSGRFPGVVRAALEFEASTGLAFNLPCQSSLGWLRKPGG